MFDFLFELSFFEWMFLWLVFKVIEWVSGKMVSLIYSWFPSLAKGGRKHAECDQNDGE